MKLRSLLLAASFLTAAVPAFAAPQHIQSFSGNSGSAASVSFTLPTAIAAGDTFVGAVFEENGSNSISSIKDDKGNTYTLLNSVQDGSNPYFVQTFALANITNSPRTITVTFSAVPSGGVQYLWGDEYSGVSAIDTHNLTHTASGTSLPSGSVTLAGTNDELWTMAAPSTGAATVPSGYTARVNDTTDGLFTSDLAFTGTGAYGGASYTNGTAEDAIVGIVGLVPVAPAPSIDLSDGSHLAPSINGDVVGVGSNGAFALVAPQAGPAGPPGPAGQNGTNGTNAGQVGLFTPTSSTMACTQGQSGFDATYIYACLATNQWGRMGNGVASWQTTGW